MSWATRKLTWPAVKLVSAAASSSHGSLRERAVDHHARHDAAHAAQADQAPRLARAGRAARNTARPAPPTK